MNRVLAYCCLVVMMLTVGVSGAHASAQSSKTTVNVKVDEEVGRFFVSGNMGSPQQVTLTVWDPEGQLDYVGQSASGADGEFRFSYQIVELKKGDYLIKVGGTNVETPLETTYSVSEPKKPNPPGEPNEPYVPSNPVNNGQPSSNTNSSTSIVITEEGVLIHPELVISGTKQGSSVKAIVGEQEILQAISSLQDQMVVTILIPDGAQLSSFEIAGMDKLKEEEINKILFEFQSGTVKYKLPLMAIKGPLQELMIGQTNVRLVLEMNLLSGAEEAEVLKAMKKEGLIPQSGLWSFETKLVTPLQEVNVKDFGNVYAIRSIELDLKNALDSWTSVYYDPTSKSFGYVPAVFTNKEKYTLAVMKRTGNSVYSVVENTKTFDDLIGHWSRTEVEWLASKLIIKGKSDSEFSPQNQVSRAEFTAMLVRAMGLMPIDGGFPDVAVTDWYSGYIGGAARAKLVTGMKDGSFKPNDLITREQMALMIHRAILLTEKRETTTPMKSPNFKDKLEISTWALEATHAVQQANLMMGRTDNRFDPKALVTRSEAAAAVKRLLQNVILVTDY